MQTRRRWRQRPAWRSAEGTGDLKHFAHLDNGSAITHGYRISRIIQCVRCRRRYSPLRRPASSRGVREAGGERAGLAMPMATGDPHYRDPPRCTCGEFYASKVHGGVGLCSRCYRVARGERVAPMPVRVKRYPDMSGDDDDFTLTPAEHDALLRWERTCHVHAVSEKRFRAVLSFVSRNARAGRKVRPMALEEAMGGADASPFLLTAQQAASLAKHCDDECMYMLASLTLDRRLLPYNIGWCYFNRRRAGFSSADVVWYSEDPLPSMLNRLPEIPLAPEEAQGEGGEEEGGVAVDSHNSAARRIPPSELAVDLTRGGLLGEGSSKEVRKGVWGGRDVAVSILRGDGAAPVQRELDVLSRLGRHAHLLSFYGVSSVEKHGERRTAFVTEVAALGSLIDHVEAMSMGARLAVLEQVAEAGEQLALAGVTHGDIAARNVLVFEMGTDARDVRVKLGDYGEARANAAGTMTSGIPLPARHSSPELVQRRRATEASDVWAFGVLAWEVFSGGLTPYWQCNTDREVFTHVVGGGRLEQPDACPDSVYRLMLACWSPAPARPTFAQLRHEVRALAIAANTECAVCLDRPRRVMLLPCRHLCLCDACADGLGVCPMCRENATGRTIVYT